VHNLTLAPIGQIDSCFKTKFGVPRQPGLATQAQGIIRFNNTADMRTALQGLDQFSHVWLVFVFHATGAKKWKPSVRPPRMGGAKKIGVLASRSPHRPNPIGLSAVKLLSLDLDAKDGPTATVQGVDLIQGTPILDIKPYLPYADSFPDAKAGWAADPIERHPVRWSERADADVAALEAVHPGFKGLAEELLSLDPRPAYQQRRAPVANAESEGKEYGMSLYHFDVKWRVCDRAIYVDAVVPLAMQEAP
jgi:tRNA-Thr(GGU) m(6)t(6)A37 methyltransferase TsaA